MLVLKRIGRQPGSDYPQIKHKHLVLSLMLINVKLTFPKKKRKKEKAAAQVNLIILSFLIHDGCSRL